MRRLSLFLLLGLLSSCAAKKTPPNPLAEVEGFCTEWAKRACNDKVVAACAATDATACQEAQQTFCESIVPDGKYSSDNAVDCLNAEQDAYSDAQLTAAERDTVLSLGGKCALILSGTGGTDAACTEDSDCNRNDGLSCVKKSSTSGKCEKPTIVMGGFDCSAADAVCVTGFYCSADSHCNQSAPGTTCSDILPCGPTSECVDANGKPYTGPLADGGNATGTCKERKAAGSACGVDADCSSNICDQGICTAVIILSVSEPVCKNLRSGS
jgi:hypothetical protein